MSEIQPDNLAAFVREVWRCALGREPAPAELTRCVDDLRGDGDPVEVFLGTLASPEAVQHRAKRDAAPLLFPPGHYYSPIVAPGDLVRDGFRARRTTDRLGGLTLDYDAMAVLFGRLRDAAAFTALPSRADGHMRYFSRNEMFSVGDALILSSMLRLLRPKRWIEVGSGFSSAILLDTLDRTPDLDTTLTFIEPYPDRLRGLLREADHDRTRIIESGVQTVPLDVFDALRAGDVLFLDTTHVSKTGSDVNHELFQILPRLASGVVIHLHDVFADFEYPDQWIFGENRSWNEQYVLRAFLMFNSAFDIIYANDGFARHRRDVVESRWPAILANPGGGLWMRKTA